MAIGNQGAQRGFRPDRLDELLVEAFPSRVVRKGLSQVIRRTTKVPSYVIEFILGQQCPDLCSDEPAGLKRVRSDLRTYLPRGDQAAVLKARLHEKSPQRVIDHVRVSFDEHSGEGAAYWASLTTAQIDHVRVPAELVRGKERLLTGGCWCDLLLSYDPAMRTGKNASPFVAKQLNPVQVGEVDFDAYGAARAAFSREQWIDALIRTMGYEPTHPSITERAKLLYLTRLIPLVETNYHLVEEGPRQTGKSFCITEFSPYTTLLAGGQITVPKLFVSNLKPPQPGLVSKRDLIGFDEIAGSSFNTDNNKNMYKNYMESGQVNRGTITVVGDAGFVFNGNLDFDPRERQPTRHLFQALPGTISDDAAFHDRWAAYLPGWELPKLTDGHLTKHTGLILDYASEIFHRELRPLDYGDLWEQWFDAPPEEWSVRDRRSISRTFSGLAKLIFPTGQLTKAEALPLLRLALELRLRVRVQLHRINAQEFPLTAFTFIDRETGQTEEVRIVA